MVKLSFSSNAKEELSKLSNLANKVQVKYELIGYLISSNTSLIKKTTIRFATESEYNINRFAKLLNNLKIDYEIEIEGKTFIILINAKNVNIIKVNEGKILIIKEELKEEELKAKELEPEENEDEELEDGEEELEDEDSELEDITNSEELEEYEIDKDEPATNISDYKFDLKNKVDELLQENHTQTDELNEEINNKDSHEEKRVVTEVFYRSSSRAGCSFDGSGCGTGFGRRGRCGCKCSTGTGAVRRRRDSGSSGAEHGAGGGSCSTERRPGDRSTGRFHRK